MTHDYQPLSRSPTQDNALPVHAQRSSDRTRSWRYPRFHIARYFIILAKFCIPSFLVMTFLGLYFYKPQVELFWYNRNWITKEIETTIPLSGCFNPERVYPDYDVMQAVYGPKHTEVQAGLPMRIGMDCYNFAGTIRSNLTELQTSLEPELKTQYHTYWRVDLAPFGERQEFMLKSFLATQNLRTSRLVIWSNGDISPNKILQGYLRRYPGSLALKVVDIPFLSQGTSLEGNPLLNNTEDVKGWVDGDIIRLLLLWNFGGFWVDMDSLLTRDLQPLLEHEFVTQWDCYDKIYVPFNGALMRFRKHSPYLCEAFHVISVSDPPRPSSTDWGSLLYYKIYKALMAGSIPPFKILPFCLTDGRSCRLDNRLPDPFTPDHISGKWTGGIGLENGGGLDVVLREKVFSVHLHNQWDKSYPQDGWVERLLLRRYDEELRKDI